MASDSVDNATLRIRYLYIKCNFPKLILLCVRQGNNVIDSDHVIQYCKEIKQFQLRNTSAEIKCLESIENL